LGIGLRAADRRHATLQKPNSFELLSRPRFAEQVEREVQEDLARILCRLAKAHHRLQRGDGGLGVIDLDTYLEMNLVGSPDQVCDKVAAYQQAGLRHLTALLFVGNTVSEMRNQIRLFARHVLPSFPDDARK
jgi:alkanesulfonate monooxygenase SsuD/methylene tetrahydromethanopterin reductase-like flavin-dependent oxidoreductase (luciferase family)